MPIEYQSLRGQARRALRTKIVTGELVPGQLYPIGRIAEELGT
jgi:DNA-binding GntR family transcriptional regulator